MAQPNKAQVRVQYCLDSLHLDADAISESGVFTDTFAASYHGPVWTKTSISSANTGQKWCYYLTQNYPHVWVWLKGQKLDIGYAAPLMDREAFYSQNIRSFYLPKNTTLSFYMHFDRVDDMCQLYFEPEHGVREAQQDGTMVQYFFSGIFLIMFLYNLFVYFSVRERSHLFYSLSILLSLSLWLNNQEFFARYFAPQFNLCDNLLLGMVLSASYGLFMVLFVRDFLKLKARYPGWNRFLLILITLIWCLPLTLWISGKDPVPFIGINFLGGLLLFISMLLLSIAAMRRGHKEARFFFWGNLIFFGFAISFFLIILGILPTFRYANFTMEAGTVFELLFFSYALADKINMLKKANELANLQLIDQLQENNRIKSEINIRLEEEVKERTTEIRQQKDHLEEKNKEILDSISYAKRIQSAILPPLDLVNHYLPDTFILYQPKDIVAGDFYWFDVQDNSLFIAAADCTGHGVPGALVSVICHNALNRAVREFGLRNPGEILDKTREIVIEEFSKSDEEVKDGMDISLLVIPDCSKPHKLLWAGAHNPLWILRNKAILELKADKQPIGNYLQSKPFTSHEASILPGDRLFLFSDGYADQFGGPSGKKFKSAQLKELLITSESLNMNQLKNRLLDEFNAWIGDLEQIDDVCLLGIAF